MFVDRARVVVEGGRGGKGAISFRREAHVPRGGPDGGDGGRGGDVVLYATSDLSTLADFRYRHRFKAKSGEAGAGRKKHGKAGAHLRIPVPLGTVVRSGDETIADLSGPARDEVVAARGGAGGLGNAHFATSTRRAPRIAEDGEPGEEREIDLELKLLADIGLVGLPNAGKSTLLAALTRARPKIAAYPFTTLSPNLGVAVVGDRELVIADIPGLIEGAHKGAGLGEEFLRHVERTRVLIHVIDVSRESAADDARVIDAELAAYGHGLPEKPQLYALNKIDVPGASERVDQIRSALPRPDAPVFAVSALTRQGTRELLEATAATVARIPAPPVTPSAEVERRITHRGRARDWAVTRQGDAYLVRGARLERLARGIDWESPDALTYFQRLLTTLGIDRELRRQGVREGDTVKVGTVELEWREAS
jgi:GTP-binding protein